MKIKKYLGVLAVLILLFSSLVFANPITEISAIPFPFTASSTTATYVLRVSNGVTTDMVVISVPNFQNAPTVTFSIVSPSGYTVYSIAALPNSAVTTIFPYRPIMGNTSFTLTLSGGAGGSGGTALMDIYLEQ